MKEVYLKYYEKASPLAAMRFAFDSLFAKSNLRRLAMQNRQRDYASVARSKELLSLHRRMNAILLERRRATDDYDYGEGYFYQSLRKVNVSGFRDTEGRVEAMRLTQLLKGRSVLEIGCHTGFISAMIADVAESVDAFDIDPYHIAIAREVISFLGLGNVTISDVAFEDFASGKQYEAVLSFANHSTYDGRTSQSLREYFQRCHDYCTPGGLFLFESHPPELEGDRLAETVEIIEDYFVIDEQSLPEYGSFLDRNRTYVVARKK